MGLLATLSFNVPPLADDSDWFVNAAAWSNYWAAVPATVNITAAFTATYIPQPFDNTKEVYDLVIDGVDKNIPSLDLFTSLVNQVAALDATVQNLRTALKNAGIITNA